MANKSKFSVRHNALADWFDTTLPEFVRLDRYIPLRKRILDDPSIITKEQNLPINRYAFIGTAAAYLLMLFVIHLSEVTGIVPQSEVATSLKNINDFERARALRFERLVGECEARSVDSAACEQFVEKQLDTEFPTTDLPSYKSALEFAQAISTKLATIILLFSSLCLIMGSYLFCYMYLKAYPARTLPNADDKKRVRTAYLMVIGTTLFYPTIFATIVLLISEIVTRIEPASMQGLAAPLVSFGGLPLFVANIVCSIRIHDLLNPSLDWRYGKVISIFFISNIIVSAAMFFLLFTIGKTILGSFI